MQSGSFLLFTPHGYQMRQFVMAKGFKREALPIKPLSGYKTTERVEKENTLLVVIHP